MTRLPPPSIPLPQGSTLPAELDRSALRFHADALELMLRRESDRVEWLVALGQTYAQLGQHAQGLAVDRRLVRAHPENPTFRYNLACSLTLTGDVNAACGELLMAIDLGYRDFVHLMADDDLAALRADARFGLVEDRMTAAGSGQSAAEK